MMSSSSKHSKPKPLDVAAEAKRIYIPRIRKDYAAQCPTQSYLYSQPLEEIEFHRRPSLHPPQFYVSVGDPVDAAIRWGHSLGSSRCVAFICPANDKRPGGDWETGVAGCEERLCRRSNLSATLATPSNYGVASHYPIPMSGVIISDHVVVFRGPHDQYNLLHETEWSSLAVISVPPQRWPKLSPCGSSYSFETEREISKCKIRGALRVAAHHGFTYVVVGDFGLGNSYRNPPVELASLWRDVLLYDTDLRGQFDGVAFVFEDERLSTSRLIADNISKKSSKVSGGSSSKSKNKSSSSSASSSSQYSGGSANFMTDFDIYRMTFSQEEVQRVLTERDPRCGINSMLVH